MVKTVLLYTVREVQRAVYTYFEPCVWFYRFVMRYTVLRVMAVVSLAHCLLAFLYVTTLILLHLGGWIR